MTGKVFRKYQYDIALEEGSGSRLVTWTTAIMVFFMTFALVINLGLAAVTKNWVTGLSGSLTVEIKPPVPADGSTRVTAEQKKRFDESIDKIMWLSGQHPAVKESRALSKDEIRALIEPWLGTKMSADMPLPALIDLKLADNADVVQLQSDILSLVPNAGIDSHADTLDDVRMLINTARGIVLLLTGIIVLLAVVSIAGIVRSKLSIHQQEVETLYLIGASDEYIARQFRHHTLKGSLTGALTAVAFSTAVLLLIGVATGTINSVFIPQLRLMPMEWALLLVAPVVFGAIVAHLTAQTTVMKALAQSS